MLNDHVHQCSSYQRSIGVLIKPRGFLVAHFPTDERKGALPVALKTPE